MKPPKILLVTRCFIKKDGKILLLHRTKKEIIIQESGNYREAKLKLDKTLMMPQKEKFLRKQDYW